MRVRGSIRSQLRNGFALLAVLVTAAAILVFIGAQRQATAVRELTGTFYPLQGLNSSLQDGYTASQLAAGTYTFTGEHRFVAAYRADKARFMSQLAELSKVALPGMKPDVTAQAKAAGAWFGLSSQLTALPKATQLNRAETNLVDIISQHFYTANHRLQHQLAGNIARLNKDSRAALSVGLTWSAVLLAAALVLALAASLHTMRSISRPLENLTTTLYKLALGHHAARARPAGPAEVRAAALSVNALADQADRLRREETEHARLRTLAREAGIRIREHLNAEGVIRETISTIEANLDVDLVYFGLLTAREDQNIRPDQLDDWGGKHVVIGNLPDEITGWMREFFRHRSHFCVQDMRTEQAELLPSLREVMLEMGVVSALGMPFTAGSELLGTLALLRTREGHPWTAPEIVAVEWVAADLGRGLNHARLYEEETRLIEELKSLDQAKSDFLATVSHELRTPLTSIVGYTEMLRDQDAGPVTPTQGSMLDTIDRNAARLRNLIEDVLTLSKIESGTFKTVFQPVSLHDIIGAATAAIQPVATAEGLTLTVGCMPAGLTVNGDQNQLDRVLMNLLANAVKFTPSGGQITVTAAGQNGSASITIADTGIGIPNRDQKTLSTRFFRASNAIERAIPGTGLGLSIVRTIVANHGGSLTITSREGHGTAVTFTVPRPADEDAGNVG
jgi:two-component system phosphate regulon sensor histidine kinase PhoR